MAKTMIFWWRVLANLSWWIQNYLLKGTTVDYSDKLVGGGFKFINPNAKASCSCGDLTYDI